MNHGKEKIPCLAQNQTGSNIALLAELFVGTASVKAGLNGDVAEMWREGGREEGQLPDTLLCFTSTLSRIVYCGRLYFASHSDSYADLFGTSEM